MIWAAVITGEPENFGSVELEEVTKQSIIVHVSASFASSVHKENVFNRGAAILAIIEKLRTKFHVIVELVRRVEYNGNGTINGYIEFESRIRVDTGREFSRDGLAFCLANEAFNRRTQFALIEILFGTDYCESYGHSIDKSFYQPGWDGLCFPVTTQTYPRKQEYQVISALAGLGGSLYKFAFDLRILQSPPLGEWSEPFAQKQVGSSAMPFKRNPIQAEKIDSLARSLAQMPRLAWDNAAHYPAGKNFGRFGEPPHPPAGGFFDRR